MRIRIQFAPDDELSRPLMVSSAAHLVMVVALLFSPPPGRGDAWGGPGGGAIQVSLIGNLQGVPLPRPDVITNSKVATESPGLFREQPAPRQAPKPVVADTSKGEEIPDFQNSRRRRRDTVPSPPARDAAPNPAGAVPFGEGGPPSLPYSNFTAKAGAGGSSFGAGNSFSGKYGWYVESVQRRISSNWLVAAVDPYVQWAPRVVVSFDILRDGTIANIETLQSSGIPSVDRSALRAIRESTPLPSLPSGYAGQRVSVEFFFDFRRD